MTRRERGITRPVPVVGMRALLDGGGRRSLVPLARLVSPSTPLYADRSVSLFFLVDDLATTCADLCT